MKILLIASMLILLILVNIYASYSDIRNGIIKNKILIPFACVAVVLNLVYFGAFRQDLFIDYVVNVTFVAAISAVLYCTHSWAGGDCKLIIIGAMLYPAQMYLSYNNIPYTLPLVFVSAFIFGYLYLLGDSIISAIRHRSFLSFKQVLIQLKSFFKRYIIILVYSSALNLIYVGFVSRYIRISEIVMSAIFIGFSFLLCYFNIFKKIYFLIPVLVLDIVASIFLKTLPIGTSIWNYLIIFLVIIVQSLMSKYNYREINTEDVKKGMILSTSTTLLFMRSNVKNLPGVSTENLSSRLSEEETESVRRWGKSKLGGNKVIIVRKIPFAIFIFLGFISYFLFWGVIRGFVF